MTQIGNEDKPVLLSSKKNKGRLYSKSDGGKGAAPRINVHSQQYRDNFDKIFRKKENQTKEQS